MTFAGTRLCEQLAGVSRSNNSRWQISSTLLSPEQINCGKFLVLFPFSASADEGEFTNASHCTVHSIHTVKIAFGTQS
jgi:hypothetical protein